MISWSVVILNPAFTVSIYVCILSVNDLWKLLLKYPLVLYTVFLPDWKGIEPVETQKSPARTIRKSSVHFLRTLPSLTEVTNEQWQIKQKLKYSNSGSCCFYCAMCYSAKHGLAIACRPSGCPSVTLVDFGHIGWKSYSYLGWSSLR